MIFCSGLGVPEGPVLLPDGSWLVVEMSEDTGCVTQISADDQGVSAVQLQNTQNGKKSELSADGVFVFIGFDPNNKLVPAGTKMNANGYVVTDEKCETNVPGIYVIGDLREKYFRQIVISASDGATAALAAAHYVETRKAAEVCELPQALQTEAS